jgi:predicted AAA+ superfamily ATPase
MKQFQRGISEQIQSKIGQQKVLIIYGSRRTGKTFLMHQIFEKFKLTEKLKTKSMFTGSPQNKFAHIWKKQFCLSDI